MNYKDYIDVVKFKQLSKAVFENAVAHGWHEKPLSKAHHMGMIITEVAEAVEADRRGKRAMTNEFDALLNDRAKSEQWYRLRFQDEYGIYIKGSVEEEFADIVIRIFDMAQEIHGDRMVWKGYYPWSNTYHENEGFAENAWYFVKEVLNWGTMNISDSVSFIFDWADHLGIDLNKHIEWKMKYNELRDYKHGGKKY